MSDFDPRTNPNLRSIEDAREFSGLEIALAFVTIAFLLIVGAIVGGPLFFEYVAVATMEVKP